MEYGTEKKSLLVRLLLIAHKENPAIIIISDVELITSCVKQNVKELSFHFWCAGQMQSAEAQTVPN